MIERPDIKVGDWISIGRLDCVVSMVRASGDSFGDCEVVFDRSNPTNRDAKWTGERWEFVETGDYGGYAEKYNRLTDYVRILKKGRY